MSRSPTLGFVPVRRDGPIRFLRPPAVVLLGAMLAFSLYGTLVPASARCSLPGAVGCPGGLLGPQVSPAGAGDQWFDVTLYDWGFWILDSTTGANDTSSWTIFEGYTIHINATSLPPNTAVGGTAYHGLGIELNATGQQLLSLAAPVGRWVTASFVAPMQAYYHQHIWCTIQCGPGHGSQQMHNLNIVPMVPLPHVTVSANATIGLAPLTVGLTAIGASGAPPYTYVWSFGDGTPTAAGANVSHTYTLGGIYYATATVTDARGNTGQASETVTVISNAVLNATLTASPSVGLPPFGTTLSAVVHGGTPPYMYNWSYGDGTGGPGGNLTRHVYQAPGVYAAYADITDASGVQARAIASVLVESPRGSLKVGATATPTGGAAPLVTNLRANVSGGVAPYIFTWTLGDGATAVGANVSHRYSQAGLYQAFLLVTDSVGDLGSAIAQVAVAAGAPTPLTVRPIANPPAGAPPLAVEAIASVENGSGAAYNVSWRFSDGGSAYGPVANHTFARAGNYTLTATATDSAGDTGSASMTVVVQSPRIAIVLNATRGDTPFSVEAGVTLAGGLAAWYPAQWSWGDGANSTGMFVGHTYGLNASGNQTIVVTARDVLGETVTSSVVVSLTPAPVANLTVNVPADATLPVVVGFTLQVTGGSGGYATDPLWSFGDSTSGRGPPSESHTYNKTGHYRVVVETNDSTGHIAVASAWVNLSSSIPLPSLPNGGGGAQSWSLTGVNDPGTAALVLMGFVGATGLAFLVRKQRRPTDAPPPTRPKAPPRPAAASPEE